MNRYNSEIKLNKRTKVGTNVSIGIATQAVIYLFFNTLKLMNKLIIADIIRFHISFLKDDFF